MVVAAIGVSMVKETTYNEERFEAMKEGKKAARSARPEVAEAIEEVRRDDQDGFENF